MLLSDYCSSYGILTCQGIPLHKPAYILTDFNQSKYNVILDFN